MANIVRESRSAVWVGILALVLSLVAFALGSAPFTPSLVLTFLSIPLAFVAYLLGGWRLPALAIYFGVMAWLVVPISSLLPVAVDHLLIFSTVLGCILGCLLYNSFSST